MTIKPMTRQELESLPASAFPLELECFDMWFVDAFKKITILSPIADTRGYFLVQKHITGHYAALGTDKLCHYPSLNLMKVKKVYTDIASTWGISAEELRHLNKMHLCHPDMKCEGCPFNAELALDGTTCTVVDFYKNGGELEEVK